jgi:alkylhydroperoxidase family enzyme
MARIDIPSLDRMSGPDRRQYNRFPSNLVRALLKTRGCTSGFLDLGFALIDANVDTKRRELVILRVAALSDSAYERMQHLPPARKAGWSDADIAAIETGQSGHLNPADSALLRFVDECVRDVRVSNQTFAEIRKFLSDQEIAETTLLVGYYMMTARFLETLKVDLDETPCAVLTNN